MNEDITIHAVLVKTSWARVSQLLVIESNLAGDAVSRHRVCRSDRVHFLEILHGEEVMV